MHFEPRTAPWRALAIIALVALTGCSASWGARTPETIPAGTMVGPRGDAPRCVRSSSGKEGLHRQPLAGAEPDPALAAQLASLPADVRRTVLAAGLEPALSRLLRDRLTLPPLDVLARRQAVELHLQSLKAQLDAAVYEADCSGDLIEHLQSALNQRENERELSWTIASIVTQAVAAIAVGSLELANSDSRVTALVGVTGGVAASSFGVAAFLQPDGAVVLEHSRNLLAPVMKGQDPEHLYPTFVFRLLTLPRPNGDSPAAQLRARFDELLAQELSPEHHGRARALLYGNGGIYDRRLVTVRERMFDELETTLAAFSRDFELLQRYLVRLLGDAELIGAPTAPLSGSGS